MFELPDELWGRLMEIGIENKTLDYRNLCCISITCRRLRRLSADDSLWSNLLISDFPSLKNDDAEINSNRSSNSIEGKLKSVYAIKYEKDRERRRIVHRRNVLKIESSIATHLRRIQELRVQSDAEKDKGSKAMEELLNLRKVRQASAALNVWQPEIIRNSLKQTIEQCSVPVDTRIKALEMELNLCKLQIAQFDNALRVEKRKLAAAKKELASIKYVPLPTEVSSSSSYQHKGKSKKLKRSSGSHIISFNSSQD